MKQRILISAALLHDPKLLIFDEPLSGLDVVTARLFKDLLQQLAAQGKAILYISHVLEVVELVCDRVIVIAKGKILADAPPAELKTSLALANLESVFAQLVQQEDTRSVAREFVDVMAVLMSDHAGLFRPPKHPVLSLAVQAGEIAPTREQSSSRSSSATFSTASFTTSSSPPTMKPSVSCSSATPSLSPA